MTDDFTQEEKDRLIEGQPYGYVLNRGPVDTKTPIYGIKKDREHPHCHMVLAKVFGSGTWLRYFDWDIFLY